jgi:hypothetical protein
METVLKTIIVTSGCGDLQLFGALICFFSILLAWRSENKLQLKGGSKFWQVP